MKINRKTIWRYLLVLALAAGLTPFVPVFGAPTPQQYPPGSQPLPGQQQPNPPGAEQQYPPQQQYPPGAEQSPSEHRMRTFKGEVVATESGKYALLVNKKKGEGYYLDHHKEASKYKGKNVKVIGTLDGQTIHVHSMKPEHH